MVFGEGGGESGRLAGVILTICLLAGAGSGLCEIYIITSSFSSLSSLLKRSISLVGGDAEGGIGYLPEKSSTCGRVRAPLPYISRNDFTALRFNSSKVGSLFTLSGESGLLGSSSAPQPLTYRGVRLSS